MDVVMLSFGWNFWFSTYFFSLVCLDVLIKFQHRISTLLETTRCFFFFLVVVVRTISQN